MKIKKPACYIFLFLCLLISSCNSTANNNETPVPTVVEATEPVVDPSVNIDESLQSMSITLPTDLIGLHEKFDFEELLKEKDFLDVTNNADGFVTLEFSQTHHKELLDSIKVLVDESINDILHDESMNAFFSDIRVYNDCTEIQVDIPPDNEFSVLHEMGLLPVKISCMIYQAFAGADEYGTFVFIFDNETKEPISQYYYSSDEL